MDEKILIIKASSLGDIVHGFSVLPFLKERNPQAEIHWVVEAPFEELVTSHPMVDRTIVINSKRWRKSLFSLQTWSNISQTVKGLKKTSYDVVFDLQGNIKSAIVAFFSRSKNKVGFSFKACPEWPAVLTYTEKFTPPSGRNIRQDYLFLCQAFYKDYHYSLSKSQEVLLKVEPEEVERVSNYISSLKREGRKLMLIAPGSTWKNKELRPEALEHLLTLLSKEGEFYYIFSWGSPSEKKVSERLSRTFPEISSVFPKERVNVYHTLISKVDVLLAMDSLPLHLCGLTKTPSFSFFGASSDKKYKPVGLRHGVESGDCPYGQVFEKRCPILRTCKTGLCIRGLSGDHLYDAFKKFWSAYLG